MAKVQAVLFMFLFLGHPLATNAFLAETLGFVAGAAATVVLAPVALTAVGFTSAGIAAGSIAASMMSAGIPVALLQSAGAAGISAATVAVGGTFGAGSAHATKHFSKEDDKKKNGNN